MSTALQTALGSWSLPVPVTLTLCLLALIYLGGWIRLRRALPNAIGIWQLAAFTCGIAFVWLAIASPLAALDDDLLSVHMMQHVLLMLVAPPLILLGSPAMPLIHGLSRRMVRDLLGPILRQPLLQQLGRTVTDPLFCWLVGVVALLGWHFPAVFELALRSDSWHEVEHASFLFSGLLFWWPVVQPWPSVARWPRWSIPLYLFMATLPCDALSAFLAFCERVVYPSYLSMPRTLGITPMSDQECAGALMWFCSTFVYLVPAVIITAQILSPPRRRVEEQSLSAAPGIIRNEPAISNAEVSL
jgi:putative membrane protein